MDERLYTEFADVGDAHWWFEARRQIVEAFLGDVVRQPSDGRRLKILDLGCGTGTMLGMLSRFGEVTGLEMYPEALEFCRSHYGDSVEFRLGSIPDDVPSDGEFDLVGAFDVLEHVEDDAEALRRVRAALRPGGQFALTVPAFPFLWGQQDVLSHHFRRYRLGQLRELLVSAGFKVGRSTYFNTWLFPTVAAVRVGRRFLGSKDHEPSSDLELSSRRVDRMLTRVMASERHVVKRASLPVGVSLLVVAERPTGD